MSERLYLVIVQRRPGGSAADWRAARLRVLSGLSDASARTPATYTVGYDGRDVAAWLVRTGHELTLPDTLSYATVTIVPCGPAVGTPGQGYQCCISDDVWPLDRTRPKVCDDDDWRD